MTSVLVVDDDPLMLEVVETVLRSGGIEVSTQTTGRGAVRAAHDAPPDCAVVDVTMPDMTGLDVASGFDAGADDYLVKPFAPHDLLNRIEALVR